MILGFVAVVFLTFCFLMAWYFDRIDSRKRNLESDVFDKYVPGTYSDICTMDDMGEYVECEDKKIAKVTFHDNILTVRIKDNSGKTISSQFKMERRNVKSKHFNVVNNSGEFFANTYKMSNLDSGVTYDVKLYRYFQDIWRGHHPDMIKLEIKDPFDEGKVSCIFIGTRNKPRIEEVEY